MSSVRGRSVPFLCVVWLSSVARSCATRDASNKDNVCKPTVPAGINRPPPSETTSHVNRVPDYKTNIISRDIADNGDRDILCHASSSAAGWRALVDTYSASTLGAKVQCLQSLTSRRVKPGANPVPVIAAMVEDFRNMCANGSDIEDEVICPLFLRALRDEYNVFRQMLVSERETLTVDRLGTELRALYDLLKEEKSSKSFDTAFLASGTKRGISGRRRGKC